MPTLAALDGGPITTVAPTTTATALTSIATGLTPGRARPDRLPHRRSAARSSTSCAGAVDGGDRRRAHPPRRRAAASRRSSARRCRWSARPSCSGSAFTEAHLRGSAPVGWRARVGDRRSRSAASSQAGERVRVRLLRRHRQDRPRARLRRRTTTPSCAPPTASSADVLEALPAGAALLVTADHGQVDVGDRIVAPDRRAAGAGRAAVGRGSVPVAARPARRGRRSARGGDRRVRASTAWVVTREQMIDERLVRPDGAAAPSRTASATSRSSPTSR